MGNKLSKYAKINKSNFAMYIFYCDYDIITKKDYAGIVSSYEEGCFIALGKYGIRSNRVYLV